MCSNQTVRSYGRKVPKGVLQIATGPVARGPFLLGAVREKTQNLFFVSEGVMSPLDLVRLGPLMERTAGRPEIKVGLIDGPVALTHPDFANVISDQVPGRLSGTCE